MKGKEKEIEKVGGEGEGEGKGGGRGAERNQEALRYAISEKNNLKNLCKIRRINQIYSGGTSTRATSTRATSSWDITIALSPLTLGKFDIHRQRFD